MNHSSTLVAACEAAWADIQQAYPEVPDVVLIVGPDSGRPAKGFTKHGHFWADRWTVGADKAPEVLLVGEALNRGPEEVFHTVLHEAVHALAHARGVKDTDRTGKYHNRRFRDLAHEVGLDTNDKADPKRGFAFTTFTDRCRAEYGPAIHLIEEALKLYRVAPVKPAAKARNLSKAECACGRVLRIAPATIDEGPITCGLCGEDFLIVPAGDGE